MIGVGVNPLDSRLYNFDTFIGNTTRIIDAARANQVTPMAGEKVLS